MRGTTLASALIIGILLMAGVACEETVEVSPTVTPTPTSTPECNNRDDKNAELMALYLSGNLTAPDELYEQILSDLTAISSKYFNNHSVGEFTPPWIPSCIYMSFQEECRSQVINGTYDAWNDLNEEYGVKKITAHDYSSIVTINFYCRLNSERLAELYEDLPGIKYIQPNAPVGDRSNIFPRQTEEGITYLLYWGYGDCPAGCTEKYYSYYVFENEQPMHIGYYDRQQDPEPDWWSEAEQNWKQFIRR